MRTEPKYYAVKHPGKPSKLLKGTLTFELAKELCGGHIAQIPLPGYPGVVIYADAEGQLKQLQPNVGWKESYLVGTIIVTASNSRGLTLALAREVAKELASRDVESLRYLALGPE